MKPRPFRIAQVIAMRLSHARDSSTVRPLREKFIIKSATDAVTMAAMVEMRRISLEKMIELFLRKTHSDLRRIIYERKIVCRSLVCFTRSIYP